MSHDQNVYFVDRKGFCRPEFKSQLNNHIKEIL